MNWTAAEAAEQALRDEEAYEVDAVCLNTDCDHTWVAEVFEGELDPDRCECCGTQGVRAI